MLNDKRQIRLRDFVSAAARILRTQMRLLRGGLQRG
jgi:hypothetical protein